MSLQDIRVTVIMACHNSSAYLDEAVRSVLDQTLGNLELILIDDCSTDNTIEIGKHYQIEDDRVSVIALPVKSGPACARNAGIRLARGEWVGILDSDDIAMPSRFEEQLRLANSDKKLVMVGSGAMSIDKDGHVIKEYRYPTDHKDLVRKLYSLQAFLPHSSIVYRRDAVRRLAYFNPRYSLSEDYDLWLRLSEVGEMASIDEPLVKIRKHERNVSNSERGLLQHRFGSAATICHFLRIQGCSDPSTSNEETTWQEFFRWADKRMMEEAVYERREAWADARAAYFGTSNRLTGALRFGTRFLQSGHASALMREKFFGSSLPERLAEEWMNSHVRHRRFRIQSSNR